MANVIEFLEKLGRDAQLRHATHTELSDALTRADIEPAIRAALVGADKALLEKLLGATPNVCCSIDAPNGEQERKRKPGPGDADKPIDKPVEDPKEKAELCAVDCVA